MENETKKNGLAVAALVLGIVGVVGCWIPFLNFVSVILGILALVFGGVSLFKAIKQNLSKGMSITGIVLGVVTVGVFLVMYLGAAAVGSNASKSLSEEVKKELASSSNSGEKESSSETSSESSKTPDVKVPEISDETIQSIKTYKDFLNVYTDITSTYLDAYLELVKGTDKESEYKELKATYDSAFSAVKLLYGLMGTKSLGDDKDTLVQQLIVLRDGMNLLFSAADLANSAD